MRRGLFLQRHLSTRIESRLETYASSFLRQLVLRSTLIETRNCIATHGSQKDHCVCAGKPSLMRISLNRMSGTDVTKKMSRWCHDDASMMLQWCHDDVTMMHDDATMVSQLRWTCHDGARGMIAQDDTHAYNMVPEAWLQSMMAQHDGTVWWHSMIGTRWYVCLQYLSIIAGIVHIMMLCIVSMMMSSIVQIMVSCIRNMQQKRWWYHHAIRNMHQKQWWCHDDIVMPS